MGESTAMECCYFVVTIYKREPLTHSGTGTLQLHCLHHVMALMHFVHMTVTLKGHCMGLNLPLVTAKLGQPARGSTVST